MEESRQVSRKPRELGHPAHPIIEVIGGAQRAGLLDSSAKRIVLERRRAGTGHQSLCQTVFKVPRKGAPARVGQRVAVVVVGVTAAGIRRQLVRRVVAVAGHSE